MIFGGVGGKERERERKRGDSGSLTPRVSVRHAVQIRYVHACVRTVAGLYLATLQNVVLFASYLASPSSLARREVRE